MADSGTADSAIVIELADEAATEALAARVAATAHPGDVIALEGALGAGKTVFARAFIRARASQGGAKVDEVPSPTFTLMQAYELAGGTVYHFDLFRLASVEEAYELGIEEAFADGISLIEWPDRLGGFLPRRSLRVSLAQGPTQGSRIVRLEAGGGEQRRWRAGVASVG